MIFVHEGTGVLTTCYGELRFGYGDYIVIPRGTTYQVSFDTDNNRLFIVESFHPIRYPKTLYEQIRATDGTCAFL